VTISYDAELETVERDRNDLDPIIRMSSSILLSASHAARCVACHGVRSHPVPVALVGECSMPVV